MKNKFIHDINERSQHIFRHIVDIYVDSGDAVGSKTLAKKMGMTLSPATIRNIMSNLEEQGLLYSQHTSAGRLPTDLGMRFFIDGLLEIDHLNDEERTRIQEQIESSDQPMQSALENATKMLSGLSSCAGLVAAPKKSRPLKQIEFLKVAVKRVLAVIVFIDGFVENRVIELDQDMTSSELIKASNYLTDRLSDLSLEESLDAIKNEIATRKIEIDVLTEKLIKNGLIQTPQNNGGILIVRGQSNLLSNIKDIDELEKLQSLFDVLETRETIGKLIQTTQSADGVQIYIGSENELFDDAGCSLIVSPYRDANKQIVGAIGVIGPKRLNYARIIPMVNYTAQILGKIVK